jgi:putative transcriptional regulator
MEPEADLFKILPEDKIPQKGKILISEPFLPDNFFNRTVVYLADHTKDGSVGFILNRPLDIKVREAVSGFDNLINISIWEDLSLRIPFIIFIAWVMISPKVYGLMKIYTGAEILSIYGI